MDEQEIRRILREADAREPGHLEAKRIEFWGGGGSLAWKCDDDQGGIHIVKAANNGQDRGVGSRLKVVTTELVCGRLAALFRPPLCPDVGVLTIPIALAATVKYPGTEDHPTSGPAFASRFVIGKDTKAGGQASLIGPDQAARIAVFQTWLCAEDPAGLMPEDGSPGLSIDHGYYLTGGQWDESRLATPGVIALVRLNPGSSVGEAYEQALMELEGIEDADIVASCACIPDEWGAEFEFRVQVARYILERRPLVRGAVEAARRS